MQNFEKLNSTDNGEVDRHGRWFIIIDVIGITVITL